MKACDIRQATAQPIETLTQKDIKSPLLGQAEHCLVTRPKLTASRRGAVLKNLDHDPVKTFGQSPAGRSLVGCGPGVLPVGREATINDATLLLARSGMGMEHEVDLNRLTGGGRSMCAALALFLELAVRRLAWVCCATACGKAPELGGKL
jgi:hypothetical protein